MGLVECVCCHKIFNSAKGSCPECGWVIGMPADAPKKVKSPEQGAPKVHSIKEKMAQQAKLEAEKAAAEKAAAEKAAKEAAEKEETRKKAAEILQQVKEYRDKHETPLRNVAPAKKRKGEAQVEFVYEHDGVAGSAGCVLSHGKIHVHDLVQVIREGYIIKEAHVSALKRYNQNVTEVYQANISFGIILAQFQDLRKGDLICPVYESDEKKEPAKKQETTSTSKGFSIPMPKVDTNKTGTVKDSPFDVTKILKRKIIGEARMNGNSAFTKGTKGYGDMLSGKFRVGDLVEVIRDGKTIHTGTIMSLASWGELQEVSIEDVANRNGFIIQIKGFSQYQPKDIVHAYKIETHY